MSTRPSGERPSAGPLARVAHLTVRVADGPGGEPLTILDDVGVSVACGEFIAVVGPSGCGKSTLLRAMAGLLPAAAGSAPGSVVEVPLRAGGRDVAWMPQRDSLLPWRRAWPNALLGARLTGDDGEDVRGHAAALFERFGLAGFERAWPHELSGGMRQRLALLRTVLAGRRLLLLDEPFSGLDPLTRRSMNRWLRDVDLVRAGRGDGAVVLVTHDVDEALLLADRVLVMSARPGRVLAVVPAADRGEAARERLLGLLGAGAVSRTSGNPAW